MKRILNNKIFLDIFLLVVIILSAGFAWRELPKTVIQSDGFVHFLSWEQQRFWGQKYALAGYETAASIVGLILPKLFGSQISSYLWFKVSFILFIDAIFYLCVRAITQSKLISFTATIIAAVSYFGLWDMYGTHCYCFFLERVITLPFMLVSFMYLHLFLINGKKLFYLLSLVLFFLGIGLNHFELMIIPPFILYPFWSHLIQFGFRKVWKGILFSIPFSLMSIGISLVQRLVYSGWGWPEWTLKDFLFNQAKYDSFAVMGRHLVYLTDYAQIMKHLYSGYILRWISSPPQATASIPYVLLIYAIVCIILYARIAKFRALLLTCISGTAGIIFINAFIRLSEITSPGSNRYLYFPTFFLSIFWAIAVWHFLLNKKGIRVGAGITAVIIYYWVNVTLLDKEIAQNIIWQKSTKAMFDYVVETRNLLAPKTLVVASFPEIWVQEAGFFNQTIGRGEVKYISDRKTDGDWTVKIPQYDHVIRINYDKQCNCVKQLTIK